MIILLLELKYFFSYHLKTKSGKKEQFVLGDEGAGKASISPRDF